VIAPSRRYLAKARTVQRRKRFGRPGGLELASIPNDTRRLRVKTWKIGMEIGNRQAASLAAVEGKGPAVKLAGDRY